MRSYRLLLVLALSIVALGCAAWLVASVVDMYDRVAARSNDLALALVIAAGIVCAGSTLAVARLLWSMSRGDQAKPGKKVTIKDQIEAARIQTEEAGKVVGRITAEPARAGLERELSEIRRDLEERTFRVVVFGTGSAGKTSLINALLGREVGEVNPIIGTTRHGESHDYEVRGVDGRLILTDTPGLSEIGLGGEQREREARELALRSDLLLFVVDHDLVRAEYDPLVALARQGKRSIVVFNKVDRFPDSDRDEILAKLRERLAGVVPPADVVPAAASPLPVSVRVLGPDGKAETRMEAEPPDLDALRARIAAILDREGDAVRAGNLLLRAHLVGEQAKSVLTTERDEKAQQVVDRFQWVTAGTVFFNPLPALDLLATGAVQFQMISEIAGTYGVDLAPSHAKTIGLQMAQTLLKLGIVEAATSLVAGVFKSSVVGFVAGGAMQAVTMAYLTHIAGLTFREYFRRGQTWGDGGMQAELARQFDLHSRADFVKDFALQGLQKLKDRYLHDAKQPAR